MSETRRDTLWICFSVADDDGVDDVDGKKMKDEGQQQLLVVFFSLLIILYHHNYEDS